MNEQLINAINRRTFLKRCDFPAVTAKDLYKGGVVTIYSRQLVIEDCVQLSHRISDRMDALEEAGETVMAFIAAGRAIGNSKVDMQ